MMDRKRKQYKLRRELTRQLLRKLAVRLLVYTGILLIVMLVAYWYCNRRIWYGYEPMYPLIHFIHENSFSCFTIGILFGFLLLVALHIWRMIRYMEDILESVNEIYEETDSNEMIELPEELHEVERQLNEIKRNVRSSREQAREAEQRKNDLIVYMAHDLKTPLTSVIGYLSLLQEETDISTDLQRKYQGIALKKAERLEELINEFFEITRFNLSQMTLELSSVNLSTMLEQIVYEFMPMFSEKGLTWELDLEKNIMVDCDVEKMERVFDNLLRNAINYSYENSCIEIQARQQEDNKVVIMFQNRGKTIPKEKLERIFEQFFRLESARSSKSGGAGLGLAIAKEIVQLHQGQLTCESENETITFCMELKQHPEL